MYDLPQVFYEIKKMDLISRLCFISHFALSNVDMKRIL